MYGENCITILAFEDINPTNRSENIFLKRLNVFKYLKRVNNIWKSFFVKRMRKENYVILTLRNYIITIKL